MAGNMDKPGIPIDYFATIEIPVSDLKTVGAHPVCFLKYRLK